MESAESKAVTDLEALAVEVVAVCKQRGWSLHWTERGAYLHLESSELVEAVRGKRGVPVTEAADVLFVLLSILQPKGITFGEVVAALQRKVTTLKAVPRYAGEQFTENGVTMTENNASARRAAEEVNALAIRELGRQFVGPNFNELAAIILRHFAPAPADNDAELKGESNA